MTYYLGHRSNKELLGVHLRLVAVVHLAIEDTEQDFTVHDGIRTIDEQRRYVETGVSRTMESSHLVQAATGLGHAVDLVPYVNGKLRWEWEPIYVVAEAVRAAARTLDTPIRWGGCWQEVTTTTVPVRQLVADYVEKRRRAGRSAFIDGPHWELVL